MSTRPDRVDAETANEYFVEGRATFIDARPREKWAEAAYTIPNAVHVPTGTGAEMDALLQRLPREKLFVVFCDEPGNAASASVARRVRELGLGDASVLEGGLRAWKAAQLPLTERPAEPLAFKRLTDEQLEGLCQLTFWLGFGGGDRVPEWGDSRESKEGYLAAIPGRVLDRYRGFLHGEFAIEIPDNHAERCAALAPVIGERALTVFGAELHGVHPAELPPASEVLDQVLSEADSALLYRWLRFTGEIPAPALSSPEAGGPPP